MLQPLNKTSLYGGAIRRIWQQEHHGSTLLLRTHVRFPFSSSSKLFIPNNYNISSFSGINWRLSSSERTFSTNHHVLNNNDDEGNHEQSFTEEEEENDNIFKAHNIKTSDEAFARKCMLFNNFFETEHIAQNTNTEDITSYFNDHSFVASYDKVPALSNKKFEIAIIGRSNVGKSSLVSAIFKGKSTQVKVSKTPGRTQTLNYFLLKKLNLYLVDMPGYGFARVPKSLLRGWHVLIRDYFVNRKGVDKYLMTLWLLDVRRLKEYMDAVKQNPLNAKNPKLGLKKSDIDFFHFAVKNNIPYTVVVTKVDSTNPKILNEIAITLRHLLLRELKELKLAKSVHIAPTIFFTSSKKRKGISEIRNYIASLALNFESSNYASSGVQIQPTTTSPSDNGENMLVFEEDEEDEEDDVPAIPPSESISKDTKKTKDKDDKSSEDTTNEVSPKTPAKKKSVKIADIPIGALAQKNKYVQRTKHLDDSVKRDARQLKSYGDIVKYKLRMKNRKKK
ncbi:hypothetical protein FDP41_000235 [Naegleria fowleri]|uniref:EngB-type G domain-containing protein n=1 Tax=Naegleria fowleri TaxID=5763 RepID=A0A6A5CBV1_NAEFO|nr:uncharacterized protein FDP41_000235 [Naegleria fowleri]KAF0985196.1 hypothetical protein FDP41_000235 [Naegleria fowleri]CAG4714258.1 unnamed protein product [Naegleria fowleri]